MPDWEKLKDWDSSDRHLNLFLFIYLHPSRDRTLLSSLRDEYIGCLDTLPADTLIGVHNLCKTIGFIEVYSGGKRRAHLSELEIQIPHLIDELQSAPSPDEHLRVVDVHTGGRNEELFDIIWPDTSTGVIRLPVGKKRVQEFSILSVPFELMNLWGMSEWLALKAPLSVGAQDMIFQYGNPLDAWYHECANDDVPRRAADLKLLLIAVYRIYSFDQGKEGDSPRTRFVRRVTALFAERDFSSSFKELIAHVQAGAVTVKDPWTYDAELMSSEFFTIQCGTKL